MKRRLVDLLRCPIHGTPLELVAWKEEGGEVLTGLLVNREHEIAYPIHEGVPRMLVFRTGVAETFRLRHAERLAREFPRLQLPARPSMPGEQDVLRTFSTEWVRYQWDDRSYWNLTPEAWFRSLRFMLDLERQPIRGKTVLEVGIGVGGVADYNARVEGAEVVGMDLGYAVDAAFRQFGRNPGLHIVQASLFAPPFPVDAFDLVYSFGVLHHSFSTRQAFESVAPLPRRGGRLYVWVYHPGNETRTLGRRVIMVLERILRPLAWRLPEAAQNVLLAPLALLYVLHQAVRAARSGGEQVRYGWREAMHAARDRFTPRFVHRHTEEEVGTWFRESGYEQVRTHPPEPPPSYLPVGFTANTSVDGVRGPTESTARPAQRGPGRGQTTSILAER
jgi:uncharacterized protein YbaR (Trm112 family)/SAM-dependent methyltransferase